MNYRFLLLSLAMLAIPVSSLAQIDGNPDLVAKRGEGEVSVETFNAAAHRIEEDKRFQTLRDRGRMENFLDQMLLNSQLAADAREAGFENDPVVKERMRLAMEEELARAWMQHTVAQTKPADYTAMAREEWQLNRDRYMTPHTVDVSHILIGTSERSDAEALAFAETLHQQILDDPSQFDALVMAHSDDPSKAGNKGRFLGVRQGQMVEPFETAAFGLELGAFSGPVRTEYGYHLIRKDGDTPPQRRKFREVRLALEQQMRRRHLERVEKDYLDALYGEELQVTRESLENGLERVFGRDVLAKYNEEAESQ